MRPNPLLSSVALLAALAVSGFSSKAEAPSSAATPAPAATAAPAPASPVKTRSRFDVPPSQRNPFWPIGWERPAKVVTQAAPQRPTILDVPPELFSVSSIVLGQPNLAVINGRDYAEGDTIQVNVSGVPVQLTVFRITDGEVVLNHRGREVKLRLRLR